MQSSHCQGNKTYQDFVLDHISFTVPNGSAVGLIGENGVVFILSPIERQVCVACAVAKLDMGYLMKNCI